MRLASYRIGGAASYGVVTGDGIVDLGRRIGRDHPTLQALVERAAYGTAEKTARGAAADLALSEVAWLPPIARCTRRRVRGRIALCSIAISFGK